MIVFDASGSMAGNVNQGIATIIPRIDEVKAALSKVLPSATKFRRVGLITFGPGPYNQCNVQLNFAPMPDAADSIMSAVDALTPAGKTPLTTAVEQAAEVLDYRNKPGVVVVITDGEETCGRSPCDLGAQLHDAAYQLTVHIIGYRVENYKLAVFTLSAVIAGIAGALYVPQVGIINPSEFSPANSIEAVIWVAIGGRGTLVGAALGAVIVNMGKTYFTSALPEYWLFALGLLFILVTLFLPQGIVGLISRRRTIPPAPKGSDVEEGKIDQSDVPAAAR